MQKGMGLDFNGNGQWMDLGNNWAGVSCVVRPEDCPASGKDIRLVPYSRFPMAYLGYLSNIGMP